MRIDGVIFILTSIDMTNIFDVSQRLTFNFTFAIVQVYLFTLMRW